MSAEELILNIFVALLCCFLPFLYNRELVGKFLAASIIYIGISGLIISIPTVLIGKLLIHFGMPQRFELIANISSAPILILILLYLYIKLSDEYDYNDTIFNKMTDECQSRLTFTKSVIKEVFSEKSRHYGGHEEELEALAEEIRVNKDKFFLRGFLTFMLTPVFYYLLSELYFPQANVFIYLDDVLGVYKYFLISAMHFIIVKKYNKLQGIKIFNKIKNKIVHLEVDKKYVYFETNDEWVLGVNGEKLYFKITDFNCEPLFSNSAKSYFCVFEDGNVFYYFHPKIDYEHFIVILNGISRFGSLKKFHDSIG